MKSSANNINMLNENRNFTIDILRVFGTLLIILAHIGIPNWLANIRTFDVTMLVIASGMSLTYSQKTSYIKYLFKRFKRLVIPTYIIITITLIMRWFACKLFNIDDYYSFDTIFRAYFFMDGIQFIWIVRVFMIIAIISPLFKLLFDKISNNFGFVLLLVFLILIDQYLINQFGLENQLLNLTLLSLIPYSVAVLVGLKCSNNKGFTIIVLFISLLAFLTYLIVNKDFLPDNYKYPPRLPYISYGIFVFCFLYGALRSLDIKEGAIKKIIGWVSKNSFTIYLLHTIPAFIFLWGRLTFLRFPIIGNWFFQYIIIVSFAMITTIYLNKLKSKIKFHFDVSHQKMSKII